jgi:hypothetical protein
VMSSSSSCVDTETPLPELLLRSRYELFLPLVLRLIFCSECIFEVKRVSGGAVNRCNEGGLPLLRIYMRGGSCEIVVA